MTTEADLYTIEVERGPAPELYKAPRNAVFYPIKTDNVNVKILPEKYLLLEDDTKYYLAHLRKQLNVKYYNKDTKTKSDDIEKLNLHIRQLYHCFDQKKSAEPITVRQKLHIASPSQHDPTKPTVRGLGAPVISKYPILTDYYYQIIDGSMLHALAIFFWI